MNLGSGVNGTVVAGAGDTAIKSFHIGETHRNCISLGEPIILRTLDHPNIVTCTSAYLNTDTSNVIMSMPNSGCRLSDWYPHDMQQRSTVFQQIMFQALSALAYLEQYNIIHGDLHGNNILYDGTTLRIVDWGTCIIFPKYYKYIPGAACGNCQAPEVVSGNITPAADVYTMGTTLYRFYYGHYYSTSSSLPLNDINPVLAKMLHQNPDLRSRASTLIGLPMSEQPSTIMWTYLLDNVRMTEEFYQALFTVETYLSSIGIRTQPQLVPYTLAQLANIIALVTGEPAPSDALILLIPLLVDLFGKTMCKGHRIDAVHSLCTCQIDCNARMAYYYNAVLISGQPIWPILR